MALCASVAAQASGEGVQTEQTDQSEYSSEQFSVPVRIIEPPEQAQRAEQDIEERRKTELEDLIAQQRMAISTEEIVWWTRLQVGLAVLGTLALFYTLYLTRRSTNAALAAVEATQDDIRPWVLFAASFYRSALILSDEFRHTVDLTITNYGKHPAFAVEWLAEVAQPVDGVDHQKCLADFCREAATHRIYRLDLPPDKPKKTEWGYNGAANFMKVGDDPLGRGFCAVVYTCIIYSNASGSRTFMSGQAHLVRWSDGAPNATHKSTVSLASIALERRENDKLKH